MRKNHKIIIDTNLWVSFLLTKQFHFIDSLLDEQKIELVFSEELLLEFIEVAQRPKLKKFFSKVDLEYLLELIYEKATFVAVRSKVKECRDENDDFLLSLAKDSRADYLLTGDKDLLSVGCIEKTKIITITEYRDIQV